jgi:hypothetical protein
MKNKRKLYGYQATSKILVFEADFSHIDLLQLLLVTND